MGSPFIWSIRTKSGLTVNFSIFIDDLFPTICIASDKERKCVYVKKEAGQNKLPGFPTQDVDVGAAGQQQRYAAT